MSIKNDSLGNRMKGYEYVPRIYLTRKIPAIIRIDGKAFHTFTKGMKKPFDKVFMSTMQETMKNLCENIQGCVFGYTQSDEITLVLTFFSKKSPTLEVGDELRQVLDRIINTHYTKISRKQRKADR